MDDVSAALLAQAATLFLVAAALCFVAWRVKRLGERVTAVGVRLSVGLDDAQAEIAALRATHDRLEDSVGRQLMREISEHTDGHLRSTASHNELHAELLADQSSQDERLEHLESGVLGHQELGLAGARHVPALVATEEREDGTLVIRCQVANCPAKFTLRLPPRS